MASEDATRVRDVMTKQLRTVPPEATLREAAASMREHDVNALVVTTTPRSIVTSTDILDAVAEGGDPAARTVADVMTESVETVTPDLFVEEVAAMMTTYGIKHLPVVDDDYVGMISSTDVTAQLS